MNIVVVNQSTKATNDQVALMVAAVGHQVKTDFVQYWPAMGGAPLVVLDTTPIAPAWAGWWPIVVLDSSDQAGALGYHTTDSNGKPYGRVFVESVLSAGGGLLDGGTIGVSVASVLSHEVLETLVDPPASLWSNDSTGLLWALEVGDPVEAYSYPITLPKGQVVTVSDFVTQAWFDASSPSTSQFDRLGLVKAPFTLGKGGYAVQMKGGNPKQVFGEEYPEWRKATKETPAARTARRLVI